MTELGTDALYFHHTGTVRPMTNTINWGRPSPAGTRVGVLAVPMETTRPPAVTAVRVAKRGPEYVVQLTNGAYVLCGPMFGGTETECMQFAFKWVRENTCYTGDCP